MDADVVGQRGHLLGILVIDREGNAHEISIDETDGTVAVHTVDAYPADMEERTSREEVRLRQAQRYAKHVFADERDRDPFPPADRPDRIEATIEAIEAMTPAAFEDAFGTYRAQIASHHTDAERPHPIPEGVPDEASVLYRLGVYLDGDGAVDAVSGVETVYWSPRDERRSAVHDRPPDLTPDAHLELGPAEVTPGGVEDGEAFRETVLHHLACQARDYYVGMDAEPPERYRVTGPGKSEYTSRYRTLEVYPDYHDPAADPFRG